jgi:hypothetical protein
MDLFAQASIFTKFTMLLGIVPLAVSMVYAVWPSEHLLGLIRPLSLATICGAVRGTALGILNGLRYMSLHDFAFTRASAAGFAEALVPVFASFGCLTAAWLCVAVGLWRRP